SAQGYRDDIQLERAADLKYQGQSFELTVPLAAHPDSDGALRDLARAFHREHERTYGHKAEGDPIQIVNLRLTARVRRPPAPAPAVAPARHRPAGERRASFGATYGLLATPVIDRDDLDERLRPGPLLIEEYDATTLVPPAAAARLDAHRNIVIAVGGRA